jgi:16S rRNA (cytosine1402-N4)-methyltransferase
MGVAGHNPVMVEEVVAGLDCRPGKTIVDATLGCGGHATAILEKIGGTGTLIGIDKDEKAITLAQEKLEGFKNARVHRMDWSEMKGVLPLNIDGFLMDLGLASFQVEDPSRGFSYKLKGPLDMRFDQRISTTAQTLVNNLPEARLDQLLKKYGEEPNAKRIARSIMRERQKEKIVASTHLAQIIRRAVRGNPTRSLVRCFQALRIAVNEELDRLEEALKLGIHVLKPKGRICVITYHSLEDRIVKFSLKERHASLVRVLTRKPILPSYEEVAKNRRARSAKLRIAEKKDA